MEKPNQEEVPTPTPQAPTAVYQTYVTPVQSLGRASAVVDCPKCHQKVSTRIVYKTGHMTHVIAVWAGLGTLCLASWLPYRIDGAKDVEHYCSSCNTLLVTKHRSGTVEVHPV